MEEFSKEHSPVNSPEIRNDYPENFVDFKAEPASKDAPVKEIKPGLIAGVLAALTLTGLFFTVTNWFDSLKIPFARQTATLTNANVNANLDLTKTDVASLLELKQKDTDQDNLTDYDELYLYKTSPYIPDSDSDGYLDGEEIANGNDPNCPAGLSCQNITLPVAQAQAELPDNLDTLTPEQVRSLLLQAGASPADVNALSNQELMDFYKQAVLQEQETSVNTGLSELAPTDFEAVTPEQLRMLLKEQGVSEQDLNILTDDDLRQLWQEVAGQTNTSQ